MNRDSTPASVPACTFIVPARDAAETIHATLQSLCAQTVDTWQVIVVDDGSRDDTAAIVGTFAAGDRRFRLVQGRAHGPGAARNTGLAAATTPFITFLDADDLLDPTYVAQMMRPLIADNAITATYCGWGRLTPGQSIEAGPCPDINGDLFDQFSAACVFPPHACMIRRAAVVDVGGFDERPTTTEDWDLWQRVARTGAFFARVPELLALYRMREHSRSRDYRKVLADGLQVIATGHAADARVEHPHPAHANGSDRDVRALRSYNHLCWAAGMALASDGDALSTLSAMANETAPQLDPWVVGGTIMEAIRITRCASKEQGAAEVVPLVDRLLDFLHALAHQAGAPDLAARVSHAMDWIMLNESTLVAPCVLIATQVDTVELCAPIPSRINLPHRARTWSAALLYGGEHVARLELPVHDHTVHAAAIVDAVVEQHDWVLLGRYLARTVFPHVNMQESHGEISVYRGEHRLASGIPVTTERMDDAVHHRAGWAIMLQELLGQPDITPDDLFHEMLPTEGDTQVLAGSELTFDLCMPRYNYTTPLNTVSIRCTVAGRPLGGWTEQTVQGEIASARLVKRAVETWPEALIRMVVREGIVGWPADDHQTLRERLRQRMP